MLKIELNDSWLRNNQAEPEKPALNRVGKINKTIMDKTGKSYLLKFEVLSESKTGSLVNGFSAVIGMSDATAMGGLMPNIGCTNNCSGGNCVAGCGGGPSDAVIICKLK